MSNTLEFKISSGLKDIIGKDLITDDFIAVFELVKNSYDAHAKNVTITFDEDKIIIADDGKGMSLDALKNKWLFVAYSAKKDDSEDIGFKQVLNNGNRRHYAGSKGVGRFSCDKLGSKLKLTTQVINSDINDQLIIDWSAFDDQNNEFKTVKVIHHSNKDYHVKFPNRSKHGTILEISEVKYWDRKKIIELKHSLEKLINPFGESDGFNINIYCEREKREDLYGSYKTKKENRKGQKYIDRDKVNGPVKNAILDILDLKTTQIGVSILDGEITTQLVDRGDLIYHIKEKDDSFKHIDDAQIELFFLNRSAKMNFKKEMGMEPVNFGSVFLFKNGFRVQPFGEQGDDSWGIDYRSQQGYNRFLSTRDLFGRVEILTDKSEQFKEVSSRDGGLIQTEGYHELIEFFGIAQRRLERYVAGVLWGEAFKRKKYFGDSEDGKIKAQNFRDSLSGDKDSDNNNIIRTNLGSKIDFIQLIKSLTNNDKVKIINYNKELVDLVNAKLDDLQPKFITDLEKIADKTEDENLKLHVAKAEQRYEQLQKQKEEADKKLIEEEIKRKNAEEEIKLAEKAKEEAEIKAKEAVEKKRLAELATLRKEKERALEEVAKLKAEKRAKEEIERRTKEEEAKKKAQDKLEIEESKNKYLLSERKLTDSDVAQIGHTIKLSSNDINASIQALIRKIREDQLTNKELLAELIDIKRSSENVLKYSEFITKSGFKNNDAVQLIDIPIYMNEYVNLGKRIHRDRINFIFSNLVEFKAKISVLNLEIVIDNLISNSDKSGADKIEFKFSKIKECLQIDIMDNGDGLLDIYKNEPEILFDLGVTSTNGSGIGLAYAKDLMREMYGDIKYIGQGLDNKGANFRLIFN
ncbi:ATP-binding protein [Labilibaculum euxinus]